MCGRFTVTKYADQIGIAFGADTAGVTVTPNFNAAPTQSLPVVTGHAPRTLRLFRWGLVPSWAPDLKMGARLINARAETLEEKPSFKKPFRERRCLVVADGFYEWKREGTRKTPYRFVRTDNGLFAFAGLWESWDKAGETVHTFTIITTSPNAVMQPVHDRMPVILDESAYAEWLNPAASPAALKRLLKPCADGLLEAYAVSDAVNSPAHNSPELLNRR